jgi:hypothetical protein
MISCDDWPVFSERQQSAQTQLQHPGVYTMTDMPDHTHEHHHGHHHHEGEAISAYFTEQLLTILVAGLFGFVAIQMYRGGMLNNLLAPQFHTWVLAGGIAIMCLVILRAVAIWNEAGLLQAHAGHVHIHDGHLHVHSHDHHHHHHDHDHDHGCGDHPHTHSNKQREAETEQIHAHEQAAPSPPAAPEAPISQHGHAGHHNETDSEEEDEEVDHGHSHDLSWVMARLLVLIFPVSLYFLGLPNATYSKERQLRMLGQESSLGAELLQELAKDAEIVEEKTLEDGSLQRTLKTKTGLRLLETRKPDGSQPRLELLGGEGRRMRFNDLNDAAFDEAKRQSLQGQTAILEGRFRRLGDKEFTLFRLKMTCCAADTVPLRVRIVVPQALSGFQDFDWVEVKGQIQFVKVPGQERYLPVIMVADITDVRKTEPKGEYEL